MAVYSGTSGSVVYQTASGTAGTLIGEMKEYTLSVEVEELDTSAFGQSWRGKDAGIKQWSGSFSGNADNADTQQTALWTNMGAGTKAELTFFLNGTAGFYGTAVILGQEITDSFDGLGETSFNFSGDGTLAKK